MIERTYPVFCNHPDGKDCEYHKTLEDEKDFECKYNGYVCTKEQDEQ
jgi:hypothetical protein